MTQERSIDLETDEVIVETVPLLSDEQQQVAKSLAQITEEEVYDDEDNGNLEQLSHTKILVIFISLYVGIFLAALDGTIVATLLAHIASEFGEFRSVAWIATGYMISLAAVQPLYGKISDIFGRKPVLLCCNVMFGIGSVMCGTAPTMKFLIFARIVQGCGGAGLGSLTTIILSDIVPLRQRGMLQGIGNILYGSGAAMGGIVGGLITDTFGWRWAFLSQGPIIIMSIIAISVNLNIKEKETEVNIRDKLRRIDFLGSFTLVTALVLFLVAISSGGNYAPWFSYRVVGCLTLSSLFLLAFIYVELSVALEPIIPLQLLKNRTVFGSSFTCWLMNMVYYSHIYYMAIYFITVRGVSPTKSGSSLIPHFIGSACGSLTCGYYMRKTGRYAPITKLGAASMFIGAVMMTFISRTTPKVLLIPPMAIAGYGFGLYLTITLVALVAAVPREYQAVTTSIQFGFKATGSTLGTAIGAAVFQNVLSEKLYERITGPNALEIISRVKNSIEEVKNLSPELQDLIIDSYLDGCRAVFICATIITVLCIGTSMLMKEFKLHDTVRR
ncbi:major facilitator superfamily domain-containing protein [Dipodascopsis uninucleata]